MDTLTQLENVAMLSMGVKLTHLESSTASYETTCSGREHCDSYFVYCLRPLGEVRLGCLDNERRTTSQSNEDDKSNIDFSLSTVLGLSNPQNLSGLGDAYEVS